MTQKALPLCLPNNVRWSPQTGITKYKEERGSLSVVKASIEELRKIKGVCQSKVKKTVSDQG